MWALQFHAILLTIVTLVLSVTIVSGIGVRRMRVRRARRVRWCSWLVVGVVVVGGGSAVIGIVVGAWSRSPAGTVEGLATGFTAATGGYAADGAISWLKRNEWDGMAELTCIVRRAGRNRRLRPRGRPIGPSYSMRIDSSALCRIDRGNIWPSRVRWDEFERCGFE